MNSIPVLTSRVIPHIGVLMTTMVTMTVVLPSYAQSISVKDDPGKQSVIRVMEDRAASMSTYYITGEHCINTFGAAMLPEVRKMVEEIVKQEPLWLDLSISDIKRQLQKIHRLHDMGNEWPWGQFSTGADASVVRQDQKWASGLEMIDYQNDRMYYRVRSTSYQKQVDVYGKREYHIGIGMGTFLPPAVSTAIRGDPLVEENNSGGYLVRYATKVDTEGITELDERLVVRHRIVKTGDQLVAEEWYLVPTEVDMYSIPRVVIVVNPQTGGPVLSCYLIDQIGLGSEAAASYIVVPEIPRESLFVDHRVSPLSASSLPNSVISNYSERIPVDKLYQNVSDYWEEQRREALTPIHQPQNPFSGTGHGGGWSKIFWLIGGGLFVVVIVIWSYSVFRRRIS